MEFKIPLFKRQIKIEKLVSGIPRARGWWWAKGGGIDTDYEIGTSYADFEKAYKEQVWVQRCINLIADCVAGVPLKLYKWGGGRKEGVDSHPVLNLLTDVNPLTMNASDLWKATVIARKVYGNCYWYLERRGGKEPKEIYWLRPSNITIYGATKPDKYIEYYEYKTENAEIPLIRYSSADIIQFKVFDPESTYYGLSPLISIREAISADLYAQAWNKYFFKNATKLDGFFTVPNLTEEQRKFMEKALRSQYRGVSKAHQIPVFEEAVKFNPISTVPKDAEWEQLRRSCREAICSALGVPPVLVVAYEAATYATAMEQKKSLWHETIIPELNYYEEVLNWNLLPQFKGTEDMSLQFDLTDVAALQEEATSKYERLFRAVGGPFLTPNEARAGFGMPPKEGGDALYIPLNMTPVETPSETGE